LNQVSMRPKLLIARSPIRSTSSALATSAATAIAEPPFAVISSTIPWSSASSRAASTTVAPRAAAIRAVARPMPLEAPVITITCSSSGFR
jgi:hypothetical protein